MSFVPVPFDARYQQRLEEELSNLIARHRIELGNGSQMRDDAAATGMLAARYMGIIAGLDLALKEVRGLYREMTGNAPAKTKKETA